MNRNFLLCVFLSLLPPLLLGCASGYKQFYKPAQGVTPGLTASLRASPPPVTPVVERAQPGNSEAILDAYAKRGYGMVGYSLFNTGRPESDASAVRQAKDVGADLVLILDPKYTGSVTSSIPITTPTTSTSYSTGSATAYGSRGSVTAYGSGTTTTFGSTTEYVPITIHRSDYGAVFFVKLRFGLGVFIRDLNDSERKELQSNKGVAVRLVVDGTPAFEADILVDDLILMIDGVSISNSRTFNDVIGERRGKLASLSILRRGQRIEKSIRLNP